MSLTDVRWIDLQDVTDERGRLTAAEGGIHIPFSIARVYTIHQVQPGEERGGHAHILTDQVAVASSGSFCVEVSDGVEAITWFLDRPERGLFLPRMLWVRLYHFSPKAVALVFASTPYDEARYIRKWEDYLSARGLQNHKS